ncbi:MAG: HdeD family acid-resistance protein [Candidatus Binatus sp.]|uniref:HdeD family acid-resistance protein n=1 Tax=Candidatus Binatus sp. TaxID=2811406 RepID=UPI00271B2011|nr:HdeD family acid-resistance protein [Candidatus Binatus sp.]MDO8434073.1 HdeD family acid-resistance protein [Candidatus Binatus sp.]
MDEQIAWIGVEEVRNHSTWFLGMGVALILIGSLAIGSAMAATILSMLVLGWLLFIAGLFEMVHGFARRRWSGFFINLLGGGLYAMAGFIILINPGLAAITLTLMIAILFFATGMFRILIALSTPLHHRGWLVVNGLISIVLGLSLWSSWPTSGFWAIGLFVGIDMIFDGWTELMLAMNVRRIATAAPA